MQYGRRVSLDDLAHARRFTAKLREQELGLFALSPQPRASNEPRALTADESIAETWREVAEWKRKHLRYGSRRVLFSVPIR